MYKYTLGRVVLFVVILAALTPIPLNLLVKLMIALFASAGFSYFLLARWRNEMAEQLASASARRKRERTRLRAALAGDDEALAAGDRAAQPAAEAKTDQAARSAAGAKLDQGARPEAEANTDWAAQPAAETKSNQAARPAAGIRTDPPAEAEAGTDKRDDSQ
jgi:hypothetical protein